MMSALPLAPVRLRRLQIPFLLYGNLCKNFFDFHIFSFFGIQSRFYHIQYIDFNRIAALNTAMRDVTN